MINALFQQDGKAYLITQISYHFENLCKMFSSTFGNLFALTSATSYHRVTQGCKNQSGHGLTQFSAAKVESENFKFLKWIHTIYIITLIQEICTNKSSYHHKKVSEQDSS